MKDNKRSAWRLLGRLGIFIVALEFNLYFVLGACQCTSLELKVHSYRRKLKVTVKVSCGESIVYSQVQVYFSE